MVVRGARVPDVAMQKQCQIFCIILLFRPQVLVWVWKNRISTADYTGVNSIPHPCIFGRISCSKVSFIGYY